jgi:hypothetical protein
VVLGHAKRESVPIRSRWRSNSGTRHGRRATIQQRRTRSREEVTEAKGAHWGITSESAGGVGAEERPLVFAWGDFSPWLWARSGPDASTRLDPDASAIPLTGPASRDLHLLCRSTATACSRREFYPLYCPFHRSCSSTRVHDRRCHAAATEVWPPQPSTCTIAFAFCHSAPVLVACHIPANARAVRRPESVQRLRGHRVSCLALLVHAPNSAVLDPSLRVPGTARLSIPSVP